MKITDHAAAIYRHWLFHVEKSRQSNQPHHLKTTFKDPQLLHDLTAFIHERLNIWQKKTAGEKPPYTTDPILSKYRFCNIFREFDRQTIEFHTLLNPIRDDFPLWLMNMFYCRLVARTETITRAGLLLRSHAENKKVYERLMQTPRPRFGTPYVFPVSVILKSPTPTRELFITEYLPSIMDDVAKEILSWGSGAGRQSVYDGVAKVIPIFKYNLYFLWTEVLIDVAYQFPELINLFGRFPIGPGSLPTMKRIAAAIGEPDIDPTILVTKLAEMDFDTGLNFEGKPLRLSAENWEGIGCEFRKYTNLKEGKGRKRLYSEHK